MWWYLLSPDQEERVSWEGGDEVFRLNASEHRWLSRNEEEPASDCSDNRVFYHFLLGLFIL